MKAKLIYARISHYPYQDKEISNKPDKRFKSGFREFKVNKVQSDFILQVKTEFFISLGKKVTCFLGEFIVTAVNGMQHSCELKPVKFGAGTGILTGFEIKGEFELEEVPL